MRSGDPLILCDAGSRIVGWNRAAAALTGLGESQAIGLPCWVALAGVDGRGGPICGPGCEYARRAGAGCPLPAHESYVRAPGGRRRVRMSTLALEGEGPARFAILIQDQRGPAASTRDSEREVRLTPRQREVLGLLADGVPVRAIAGRLGLSEATVRNYVRRILLELRCRSQLEAVAAARRAGIV